MLKCIVRPLPGREISGILPNNKRISGEMTLCLNKREILKCMKFGTVYGVRADGSEVILTDSDTINREIMDKVEEVKETIKPKHSVLDITGTTREEKKTIVQEVAQVKPTNNNSNNYNKNNRKNNRYNNNQYQKKETPVIAPVAPVVTPVETVVEPTVEVQEDNKKEESNGA